MTLARRVSKIEQATSRRQQQSIDELRSRTEAVRQKIRDGAYRSHEQAGSISAEDAATQLRSELQQRRSTWTPGGRPGCIFPADTQARLERFLCRRLEIQIMEAEGASHELVSAEHEENLVAARFGRTR